MSSKEIVKRSLCRKTARLPTCLSLRNKRTSCVMTLLGSKPQAEFNPVQCSSLCQELPRCFHQQPSDTNLCRAFLLFQSGGQRVNSRAGVQDLSFPQDTLLPVHLCQFIHLNQVNQHHSLMLSTEQENSTINIMRSGSPFPLCRTSFGLISLFREIVFLLNFLTPTQLFYIQENSNARIFSEKCLEIYYPWSRS